jgi:HD-GYP domain-containing protein (c-di-GMP phosphodiesterase class II)/CHASE2 domain-containing sensor protein
VEKTPNPRVTARRLVLLCGVIPALLTVGLAIWRPAALTQLDRRVYDGFLRALPATAQDSSRVTVIDIDERSLATVGQWPWGRDVIAELVTRLGEMGAVVVALDVIFPESDRFQRADSARTDETDAALASALRQGHVVVGYAFTFNDTAKRSTNCALSPLTMPVVQSGANNAELPVFRATGVVCSLPQISGAAQASGFLNAVPDSDGMLRRLPLVIEHQGRLYPALGLAAAMAATGARAIALRMLNVNATSLVLDAREVPLDARSNLLLRYRGRTRSLRYVSAVDVLQGRASPAAVRNRIAVVGATALGTRDGVATPFDTLFPGVEVQATLADNLLRGDFIARPADAPSIELAAVVGLGIGVTILVARFGLAWGSAAGLLLLAGAWRGSGWLMTGTGVYLSPVLPAIGLLASMLAATLAKLAQERHRAESATDDSEAAQRMMVQSLLSLTEIRDAETGSHSRRTQQYSRLLAMQLCDHPRFRDYLTPPHIEMLSTLAPLHDIGKVGIPDQLLNKPGALTDDEYREMKKHPGYGLKVITTAQKRANADDDETLTMAKDIVYTHHERWDGAGYPRGLKGEQIPIPGRVMAVVDAYDALTTARCYRGPMPHERAVELIVDGEGTHFDPAVIDAFRRTAPLLYRVAHESNDTAFASVASARGSSLNPPQTGRSSAVR